MPLYHSFTNEMLLIILAIRAKRYDNISAKAHLSAFLFQVRIEYHTYLNSAGIDDDHIIELALDEAIYVGIEEFSDAVLGYSATTASTSNSYRLNEKHIYIDKWIYFV